MDPFVVVGGGISGTTCAKVFALDNPHISVILVSASPIVKVVSNLRKLGRTIDIFDVIEKNIDSLERVQNLTFIQSTVIELDSENRLLKFNDLESIKYSKLCICTGARPNKISCDDSVDRFVKTIRDTDTAQEFQDVLAESRRVMILGNGGIATELAHKITHCELVWVMKDDHFGATFFDPVISKFFSDFLYANQETSEEDSEISKRQHFTVDGDAAKLNLGVALGPDWQSNFVLKGLESQCKNIQICKSCGIVHIYGEFREEFKHRLPEQDIDSGVEKYSKWNIYVELTNGQVYPCDYLVSATGVIPNVGVFLKSNNFNLATDGGLEVSQEMLTNVEHVYACGDACTTTSSWPTGKNWFQMRLWTQARQMGFYAAKCIGAHLATPPENPALYFNFDVFTHATQFFGLRVILLGDFNGSHQTASSETCQWKFSIHPKEKLIKIVHRENRMIGAVLIGNTEFEETFENLIYTELNLENILDDILDDTVDFEDFFD